MKQTSFLSSVIAILFLFSSCVSDNNLADAQAPAAVEPSLRAAPPPSTSGTIDGLNDERAPTIAEDTSGAPRLALDELVDISPSELRAAELSIRERTRECMVAEGFEYAVIPPELYPSNDERQELALDSREERGYGITFGIDARPSPAIDDPHSDYTAQLSSAELIAYTRALLGDQRPEHYPFGNGCLARARAAVYSFDPAAQGKLQQLLADLETRIEADARVIQAWSQWQNCVLPGGINANGPSDLHRYFYDKVEQFFQEHGNDAALDTEALKQLQGTEVTVAVLDFKCQREYVQPVVDEVRPAYEADFITEHEALLLRARTEIRSE